MTKKILSAEYPTQRPLWFNLLLWLDAFALGSLVAWRMVLNLLTSAARRVTSPDAIGTFFHIDDLLFPYWLGNTVFFAFLMSMTAAGFLWMRTKSKVVTALPVAIPIALGIWFLLARR